jgi:hypothetical protein
MSTTEEGHNLISFASRERILRLGWRTHRMRAISGKKEMPVKRLISLIAVLFVAATLFAFDEGTRPDPADRRGPAIIDEVIRMSQAGVGDDAIISYIRNTRQSFEVTSDDLIALTNARVSDRVVRALQDEAAARRNAARRYGRSTVLVAPYPYPYYYDPYFYDPFFYPRFSLGVGFVFGGPRFIGGGFHHHR